MKVFNAEQIRKIDAFTIANEPIKSVELMERAAIALHGWMLKKLKIDTPVVFFVGPGNNGGDGWALARLLYASGFINIKFFLFSPKGQLSEDSEVNKKRLLEETGVSIQIISSEADFPVITTNDWVVDALFGSGLTRSLEGLAAGLVTHINEAATTVIAIDIPSGLFCGNNSENRSNAIVKAAYTLSFQFPKQAFLFSENERYVGQWTVLPIGLHADVIEKEQTPFFYQTEKDLKEIARSRSRFSHKGTYGHCLIISGCYGMMGAAVLAAKAAVRSGSGLVSVHVPRLGYPIIQASVPEAIVSIDESDIMYTGVNSLDNYSAIGLGPGLGCKVNTSRAVIDLVKKIKKPMVLDADALNILAAHEGAFSNLPPNSILTPHPGEFDRMTQKHSNGYTRFQSQLQFSAEFGVIVVLKGANTSITVPDGTAFFNATGNPGMAKGGSGDVLTGLITGLMAQKYSPVEAARLGVFIHGKAGDLALKHNGYHALSPSDLINNFGKAFKKIEK